MSADAFRNVTEALRERIANSLPDPPVDETSIHIGPLDDQKAKDARLVLFLYRASVNADLRNAGHRVVSPNPNDPIVVFERALPFDLHYLVSASPSSAENDLDGLRDLGVAIQALNDTPDLVGGLLAPDAVHLSFEAMSTEEMGRIWALFPAVNYRTSVVLLATPVWVDPAQQTPSAHPVVQEDYGIEPVSPEVRYGA
ncbi:DUF4255 domain-containing protein [Pararhizobium sp. BT-229]|uniref:DUF4255 domain-containing protein n=1 Tax=Pararhizobium sp. BT-229 TaxID=2986923 RepID=UPI0021F75488|nr:DUF4255 domain-containing protein [Pararhizobium sp. BT-229]MCV9961742.1 DUF4255 domain-containing protein [Pararhizobium sp. BT-229]